MEKKTSENPDISKKQIEKKPFFKSLNHVYEDGMLDGWISPDGEFTISNRKDELTLHDECAHYLVEKDKETIVQLIKTHCPDLNNKDISNLNARIQLQHAGYLLISSGLPQYISEPTDIQMKLLSEAGYKLPEKIKETFRKEIPEKKSVYGILKDPSIPFVKRGELKKQLNNLYLNPEMGIVLKDFNNERFNYYSTAEKIFNKLSEKSNSDIIQLGKKRFMGSKTIKYKEIGNGISIIYEKNTHAINDEMSENSNKVVRDYHIYYQKTEWIKERIGQIYEKKNSYYNQGGEITTVSN